MNKLTFLKSTILSATILILTGCITAKVPLETGAQFAIPQKVTYNKQTYNKKFERDLGEVGRFVYFKGKESPKNWKSEIELLVDRQEIKTIQERIALRQKVYQNSGVSHFYLTEENSELYSFVIYPPSKQFANWQVNVARGKNVGDCGFAQYQFVTKIDRTAKIAQMGTVKLVGYLKKYVVDKQLNILKKTDFSWQCLTAEEVKMLTKSKKSKPAKK